MKKALIYYFLLFIAVFAFTACGDLAKELEQKINELNTKTESLDSLVNQEFEKVLTLDSLINSESEKVKKLDSLIDKSASRIDSISNRGSKILEKFNN